MKNIFQALGLKEDHRPTSKIAQLAKHSAEVNVASNREGPFFVDDKYDGNHAVIPVVKGKVLGVFSRVGKPFTNMDMVLSQLKPKKMPDGVYFGELHCEPEIMPMMKFQALHGANRTNPLTEAQTEVMSTHSKIAIFDYLTIDEFKEGETETPLKSRRKTYEKAIKEFSKSSRIFPARYVKADTIEEAEEHCANLINQGKEGGVIKGVKHGYICGHKNFHFMKKVKKITLDLECIGYTKGTRGKRKGTLETLQFKYGKEGQHVINADLGKGYTDEERLSILEACEKGGKKSPVGKIFEIYALEKIGLTNLRQPKVGKIREDKDSADTELPETKKEKKVKDKKNKKQKEKKVEAKKYEDMSFEELFSLAKTLKIDVSKKVVKKEKADELIKLIKESGVTESEPSNKEEEPPKKGKEKKGKKDKPIKEDKKAPKKDKKSKKKNK